MRSPSRASSAAHSAYATGAAALVLALGSILGALGIEHIGGYAPCPLCLTQRHAYYVGVPLLFLALVLVAAEQGRLAGLLFLAVAFGFLANAGLATYHTGVEWKLWAGPDTCAGGAAGALTQSAGDLLKSLSATRVVRCDAPALLILGLSMAAWNVLVSLALFVLGLRAAFLSADHTQEFRERFQ
ncbi:MAG TPA: disulfide bond formation protein B [Hyphomicrobiaceae bacterium]|nr:disulfide bond formation protein B [Hyphomicrobiaceae bacterium]